MSSKVQAWRTPVIEPSAAQISSLAAVIQTWGCASATLAPSASAPVNSSKASKRCIAISTSGRLGRFQQAAAAQQGVRLRLPAAERDIGVFRIARAARGIDVVVQA